MPCLFAAHAERVLFVYFCDADDVVVLFLLLNVLLEFTADGFAACFTAAPPHFA